LQSWVWTRWAILDNPFHFAIFGVEGCSLILEMLNSMGLSDLKKKFEKGVDIPRKRE
jgi:hypothetical protein